MRKVRPLAERFNEKVDRSGGPEACWPWTARRSKTRGSSLGYGIIAEGRKGGRSLRAHRVAWALANGTVPEDKGICHSCDNPPCCNPAHLFPGTQTINAKDMWTKKRGAIPEPLFGEEHPQVVLSDTIVLAMRAARRQGHSYKRIERDFGAHWATARDAVMGITWPHLPGPVEGRRRSPVKLTHDMVTAIRTELVSDRELADRFGVERHAVGLARRGKTWAHHPTPPRALIR